MFPNYEGIDDLGSFKTPDQLSEYRAALLKKTERVTTIIKTHVSDSLSVIEVGSGNGRLIISLVESGVLDAATGIELAESRTKFAQRWRDDLLLSPDMIAFYTKNVLLYDEDNFPVYDLAVCITGCFQYFTDDESRDALLRRMRKWGNKALFELYNLPEDVASLVGVGQTTSIRVYDTINNDPRWKYYLSQWDQKDTNVFLHQKTFVGHHGELDENRSETLRYYAPTEFVNLLWRSGFKKIEYMEANLDSTIVIAS